MGDVWRGLCSVGLRWRQERRWAQRGENPGAFSHSSPGPLGTSVKHPATVLSQETCGPLSPGQQGKLKQVTPLTEEEKTEHGVAAERRRMRLVYADTIKDLLSHCAIQDGECVSVRQRAVGVAATPLGGRRKGSPCRWSQAPLASLASRSLPGKSGSGVTHLKPRSGGGGVGTYGNPCHPQCTWASGRDDVWEGGTGLGILKSVCKCACLCFLSPYPK